MGLLLVQFTYIWVLESVLINKMSGDDAKWEENVVYVILFKLHLNSVKSINSTNI